MRYCIIGDDSGHRWLCPLDRKQEVEDSIRAVEEYWSDMDPEGECPEDLTEGLTRLEGGTLSFTDPMVDGERIGKG